MKSVRDHDVVLLDEVSFVKDWDRAIKHAVDNGYPRILVVTGSHAHDLKRGADRMPGRFDGGGEFSLLPMLFFEFQKARQQAGWTSAGRLTELRAYFRVGGFPTAVALTTQTPTSLQTLAKKTRIGSHNTVADYLSVLNSCFALRTLHAVDIDTGAYRFRKERKFYFSDPLLYWMALDLSGQLPPDDVESRLAELVAHEHLFRCQKRFGYHSNDSGEVDFVLPKRWAIEVKWSDAALNLSKTYLRLLVPEKIVWTQNNFLSELPTAALTGSRVAEGVLLVLAANTEAYPAEIAQSLNLPPSAVLAQLRRFEDAEFIVRRNVGRTALYTFNPRGKTAALLKGLVTNVLMQMAVQERLRFTFLRRPRSAGKAVVGG